MRRHVNDPYVKLAQKEGYRSRSAYKLIELDEKDRLLRPGLWVMDLGSAPGGWSQVVARAIGPKGRVLATDILPMDSIGNVDFIQGDFTSEGVVEQVLAWLDGGKQYTLRIPKDAPVAQFWSFTVYDNETRCFVDTGTYPDRSSRDGIVTNSDGSVDIYIQNTAPTGRESNWLPAPSDKFILWLRVYIPGEAILRGEYAVPPVAMVN